MNTQDEWSVFWFDRVCERLGIPPHADENRVKLALVALEERVRLLDAEVRALRRPWWRRGRSAERW